MLDKSLEIENTCSSRLASVPGKYVVERWEYTVQGCVVNALAEAFGELSGLTISLLTFNKERQATS